MSQTDSALRSCALMRARMEAAAGAVARVPGLFESILHLPSRLPRVLVTTGIGTSEGHARHLAELAARLFGQPARFASTGSLMQGAPPEAEHDWLVVFSQGLSPNARHAFRELEAWGGVLLVTGVGDAGADDEDSEAEARAVLAALEARGVLRIEFGCGTERGLLLRVIGARVGYAVAWSLLRTLAARRLGSDASLAIDPEILRRAQHDAETSLVGIFPEAECLARFFAPDRALLLIAEEGRLELAEQLSLKLAEGMLRPQPRCVDVLEFAHGPLQSLASRPASILYLDSVPDRGAAHTKTGRATDSGQGDWLERLKATLDPALHDLRVLRASLPWPFAVLEFEAMFDVCVLRGLEETGLDLVAWPGAEREGALYLAGPAVDSPFEARSGARPDHLRHDEGYEQATWREIGASLEAGRRSALIALGSIEQHGPHLPLGTDRWIAQALADGLAARLDDAIALPALALGCASEHLDFAGTLHLEPATLEALLRDLLGSIARHGFDRAFVFTAHGGNVDALEEMGARLAQGAPGVELRIETGLGLGALQAAAVSSESLDPASAGPHAGEFETSVVARLRPGSIRREALAPGRIVRQGSGQDLFYPSLRPNAASGVLGDPSHASAERGDRYLEAWLDRLEAAYRAAFPARPAKNRKYTKGTQKA